MWKNIGPRTNNRLEGWHYRLNQLARKAHPNMFETIELIKNEQASTEIQTIQLTAGDSLDPKGKAVEHDEQVKKLAAEFSNGQKTNKHRIHFFQH